MVIHHEQEALPGRLVRWVDRGAPDQYTGPQRAAAGQAGQEAELHCGHHLHAVDGDDQQMSWIGIERAERPQI
jgi:hypothetical protein